MQLNEAAALCYRIYDVADGIDLEKVRALTVGQTKRLALTREGSEYVQLSNPPLAVDLGPRSVSLRAGTLAVTLSARFFDHGAVSLLLRVPLPKGATIEALVPLVDELGDSPAVDALARAELKALCERVAPAFDQPHDWPHNEGYTVVVAREVSGRPTASEVLAAPGLARLLLGEAQEPRLSPREEAEVLEHHTSYTDHDLAVVEWSAAFLYEPSGSEDLVDLLEVANAQLLELRYYDDVLDQELQRAYQAIARRQPGGLVFSPYRKLSRELMRKVIELSAFIERIENSLKIVGDVYLARVYELAVRQLRVPQWTEQVTRKHRLLQQTYALLRGEVDHDRTLTLEVMVVVLILFEVVMAFVKAGH